MHNWLCLTFPRQQKHRTISMWERAENSPSFSCLRRALGHGHLHSHSTPWVCSKSKQEQVCSLGHRVLLRPCCGTVRLRTECGSFSLKAHSSAGLKGTNTSLWQESRVMVTSLVWLTAQEMLCYSTKACSVHLLWALRHSFSIQVHIDSFPTTRAIRNQGELTLLTVAAPLLVKILHTNSFPALSVFL